MKDSLFFPMEKAMTFPLELAQMKEKETDINYLYPTELGDIQKMVSEICDQMEYDGSMMYDCYPDKVTTQRLAKSICQEEWCHGKDWCDKKQMQSLVEIMICHEMSCRRWNRQCRNINF